MRRRVAVISPTAVVIDQVREAFNRHWPDGQCDLLIDEALYSDYADQGQVGEGTATRIRRLIDLSIDAGASAVLFAGSVFGAEVVEARSGINCPVFTSFDAMIMRAFECGSRLIIQSTAPESARLLELELRDAAARQGITADIHRGSLPDAFEALYGRGDRDLHDRLVAGAVNKLETYDAVLLAQFSMASVRPLLHLATPVLDPISEAVQRMRMLAGD